MTTQPCRPEIGMVVVQPTAFCNINCTYCYLPDRDNKHVIAQSTVSRLFGEIFAAGWACPELTVVWHAGGSLVMADELLALYVGEGIEQICFTVEESEGDHVSRLVDGPELRPRYAALLRRFWHGARARGRVKFLREIDLALPRLFRPD